MLDRHPDLAVEDRHLETPLELADPAAENQPRVRVDPEAEPEVGSRGRGRRRGRQGADRGSGRRGRSRCRAARIEDPEQPRERAGLARRGLEVIVEGAAQRSQDGAPGAPAAVGRRRVVDRLLEEGGGRAEQRLIDALPVPFEEQVRPEGRLEPAAQPVGIRLGARGRCGRAEGERPRCLCCRLRRGRGQGKPLRRREDGGDPRRNHRRQERQQDAGRTAQARRAGPVGS